MRRYIAVILVAVAISALFTAETARAETGINFDFSTGYRVDDLDWSIAGDMSGNNPNILSELTWSDLEIYQVKIGGKIIVDRFLYMRGSFGYGWIVDGKNEDSDYNGDNRTQEFSRSNNSADDGDVLDASFGIGYQFRFGLDRFGITPLVGYSYHEQHLTMTDGFQTIPATGPFGGLDSTYDTEWEGPWVGLDVSFEASKKITLFGNFEYHWADYYAEANWNLRTDLAHSVSFTHDADGTGIVVSVGVSYAVTDQLLIHSYIDYQDWTTDPGVDRVFFADGTADETRLNEVNWNSSAIMAGVTYRF